LKKSFARPGFAAQIAALEGETKAFAALFTSKAAAAPSAAWKMLFSSQPEPILWLAHTTKSAPLKARFDAFFHEWSQARLKIPYQLMQEMRITPELPIYAELLDKLFFAIMDGLLETPEAARAFLEPYSPPAPPPPVSLRRRAVKRETKAPKPRSKKAEAAALEANLSGDSEPVPTPMATNAAAKPAPASAAKPGLAKPAQVKKAPVPVAAKAAPAKATAKKTVAKQAAKPVAKKPVAKKPAPKPVAKKAAKPVAASKKPVAKKATKVLTKKPVKKPTAKPVKKVIAKAKPKAAKKAPVAKHKKKAKR
jgi:hypothetical protein